MISVIGTVYNERESIHRLLDSLCEQTRPPDDVVIVDGGSTDGTPDVMQPYTHRLPLRVIVVPGANISAGRNRAFAESTGDIIAITDAGVTLPPDWLEQLTNPFTADESVGVVAGFFRAEPYTVFEAAMGATVLPLADEIDAETFLPSSRSVAVRRAAYERVGGYPEWLDYCEDLIFDLRLKQVTPFAFAPDACVGFRPRGSLRAFYKQYYLYARGDGKADLWRKRHAIRYVTYLVALPALLILGFVQHPAWWGLLVLGGVYYLGGAYRRLPTVLRAYATSQRLSAWDVVYAVLLVPVIRIVGDVAKMIGYPVGWRWRLRERPPAWRDTSTP